MHVRRALRLSRRHVASQDSLYVSLKLVTTLGQRVLVALRHVIGSSEVHFLMLQPFSADHEWVQQAGTGAHSRARLCSYMVLCWYLHLVEHVSSCIRPWPRNGHNLSMAPGSLLDKTHSMSARQTPATISKA